MSYSYHKIELAAKCTHPIVKYMSVLIEPTPLNPSSPLRNAHITSTSASRFGKLLAAMFPASCPKRFADCACSWLRGEPGVSNRPGVSSCLSMSLYGPCKKFRHDIKTDACAVYRVTRNCQRFFRLSRRSRARVG